MKQFANRVAVITGAASGFGLEFARQAASRGMHLVLADVEADALESASAELRSTGTKVLSCVTDVSNADQVTQLADRAFAEFGAVHLLFNNAGVAPVGLVWEHSAADWQWVLGVNVIGVANGLRSFVPRMLAQGDDSHIINTASVAGFISPTTMGLYNASKHAVVSLSETLYQDLGLVTAQVRAHVLCPYFVPTGIHRSERNRPHGLADPAASATRSQRVAQAMSDKAVTSGKVSAAQVAQFVFDAMAQDRFYVFSHPGSLGGVGTRMEDVLQARNPSDPFAQRPQVRAQLLEALADRGIEGPGG